MLPLHHLRKWLQRWELNPQSPRYELGAFPLSYAATMDSRTGFEPAIIGFADQCLSTWRPGDLVETWGIEPHSCNRPFVGFGTGDTNYVSASEDDRS